MSSSNFQPLQGMSDIALPEIAVWQRIESLAREVFERYACSEIRTPILERTEVFTRSIGDETDIVQKEMYSFEDRGGRSLTMRPEGTAGVVRYLASLGPNAADARLYYIGPMFRAERPQAGRKRQFHQCGVEMLGEPNPLADAECIALQMHLLAAWGLSGCRLQINTRGAPEEQEHVTEALRAALAPRREQLCENCRRRFDANVLRILDCKNPDCGRIVASLPPMTEFMSEASRDYLENVVAKLRELGLDPIVNPNLVRGLDYYNHTVWEISHAALGAQDALAGGGRYTINFDRSQLQGVGFAMGLERVIMAMEAVGATADVAPAALKLWLVGIGDQARDMNFLLAQKLRRAGVSCNMDLAGRSMKAQMRSANRAGTEFVLIRGEDELQRGVVVLKTLASGEQREMSEDELCAALS
jgi:histidyl-tRNA synthetase